MAATFFPNEKVMRGALMNLSGTSRIQKLANGLLIGI